MKKLVVILSLLLPATYSFAQTDTLRAFLEQGNLFKVKQVLEKNLRTMDKNTWLYYKCFLDNGFGKYDRSILETDLFVKNHSKGFSEGAIAAIKAMNIDNYAGSCQYKKAADEGDMVISKYSNLLPATTVARISTLNKLYHALQNTKPQVMPAHKADQSIAMQRDKAGQWRVPVTVAREHIDFSFDTHVSYSIMSKSSAKKTGLKLVNATFDVPLSGSANAAKAEIAVADSIVIGDSLVVRNVVFFVVADSLAKTAGSDNSAVLGLPVLMAMKELQISQKGMLKVPAKTGRSILHNMEVTEGKATAILVTDTKDTLLADVCTALDTSYLQQPYYKRYKNDIVKNGTLTKNYRPAINGTAARKQAYELKNISCQLGLRKMTIPAISALLEPTNEPQSSEVIYGQIGRDVLQQFDLLILNFDDMYIDLR